MIKISRVIRRKTPPMEDIDVVVFLCKMLQVIIQDQYCGTIFIRTGTSTNLLSTVGRWSKKMDFVCRRTDDVELKQFR